MDATLAAISGRMSVRSEWSGGLMKERPRARQYSRRARRAGRAAKQVYPALAANARA
jgi:hypothetical protein